MNVHGFLFYPTYFMNYCILKISTFFPSLRPSYFDV